MAFLFPIEANAKKYYGGEFSFAQFFGPTGLKNFGAGIYGEYAALEKIGIKFSTHFYLPENYEATTEVQARLVSTDPYSIEIPVESRTSFTNINLGAKRYLVGRYVLDDYDRWGLYVQGDFGLLLGHMTSTVPRYDTTLYDTPIPNDVRQTFINWTTGAGLGADVLVGKSYLFVSAMCRMTIDQANQIAIRTELPVFMMYNFGIRIPYGAEN